MAKALMPLVVGVVVGAAAAAIAFRAGMGPGETGEVHYGIERLELSAEPSDDLTPVAGSVASGLTPGVPPTLLRLAESDVDAALAALVRIEHAKSRRDAALALLDVLGSDQDGIDRIAAALSAADGTNFTFDAIAKRAAGSPQQAIGLALALDDLPAQTEAIRRIAALLAASDPQLALVHAAAFDNYELADLYRSALLEKWASLDPDAFLEFVATAAAREIPAGGEAFRIAAAGDPAGLLALIDAIPQSARSAAERYALEALARTDPRAAFAHIDSLPEGDVRDGLLTSTARSFARQDLDGALAWLESLQPPEASATRGVFEALAAADPVRGADFLIAKVTQSGSISAFQSVWSSFTPGSREELSLVAARLSSEDNSLVEIAFERFMDFWSQGDVEAAHDWALANVDRMTPGSLTFLARNLSAERPELAKQAADRLPADLQNPWIRAVASALARADIDEALQWVARYQGQPVYADAVRGALQTISLMGGVAKPESVAMFLERQVPEMRANSAPMVANLWAERDPAAAARWTERIDLGGADESRRNAALSNVAMQWASRDPDAARDWVLALPPGAGRDQVLGSLLGVTAATGVVDTLAIDAFSSDQVRQRRLAYLMISLGTSDPDLGRALIDRYIDNSEYRAVAEEQLIEGASNQSLNRSTGFVIYN